MAVGLVKANGDLLRLRVQWRDQVFGDRNLTAHARVVGYQMANFITMTDTVDEYVATYRIISWPAQLTLDATAGFRENTISESVKRLIGQGHLRLDKRGNQITGA